MAKDGITIGKNICVGGTLLELGIPALGNYVPKYTAEVVKTVEHAKIECPFSLLWDEGGNTLWEEAQKGLFAMSPTMGRVSLQGVAGNVTSAAGICVSAKQSDAVAEVMSHLLCDKETGMWDDKNVRIACLGENVQLKYMEYLESIYTVLTCPEYASNTAKYDGIRYGVRVEGASMEETYISTRTTGFDLEQKKKIILGNFLLSKDYYKDYYDNAFRMREVIKMELKKVFQSYDMLILPHPLLAVLVGAPVIMLPAPRAMVLMGAWGLDEKLLQVAKTFMGKEGADE